MSTRRGGRGRGAERRREAAREAATAVGMVGSHDPADHAPWPAWAREATAAIAEGAGVSTRTAGAVAGVALDRARRAAVQQDLDYESATAAFRAGRTVQYRPAPIPPLTAGSRSRLACVAQAAAAFLPEAAREALAQARRGAPGYTTVWPLAWGLAAGAAAVAILAVHLHP